VLLTHFFGSAIILVCANLAHFDFTLTGAGR